MSTIREFNRDDLCFCKTQVTCPVCKGRRYNEETLQIEYKGHSIYDVLLLSVSDAIKVFKDRPSIQEKLIALRDVGLGYIRLGQPATTLSGGEAQRVKMASEIFKKRKNFLFILDEPTSGLHIADVKQLLVILQEIVEQSNTVLLIEHNLELVKCADYIIDLGPEGGSAGGYIVAEGTPEEVLEVNTSYTGQYLKNIM